jgi:ribonuclease E
VDGTSSASGTSSEVPATGDPVPEGSAVVAAEGSAAPAAEGADRDRGRRRRGGRDRNREGREGLDGGPDSVQPIEGEATPAAALTVATFEDGPSAPTGALADMADRADRADRAALPEMAAPAADGDAPAAVPQAAPATPVATPRAATASTPAPVEAPIPAPVSKPYVLATDELHHLAQAVGLEWVNSDADKIRTVQAAMAAEPRPIHLPREPRRQVMADDGPLVLVETRKNLAQIRLPFEQTAD